MAAQNRQRLVTLRGRALAAHASGNDEAVDAWLNFLQAAMQIAQQREWLLPLARKGDAFKANGRGPGKVKRAVRAFLAKTPDARPSEIWNAWTESPPRGFALHDDRLGKYLYAENGSPESHCGYARFANIVSEVRKELKSA